MSFTLGGPDYVGIATQIGLDRLRDAYPQLTGAGISVGQVEGSSGGTDGGIDFEVDPASLGHPADNSDHFITYWAGAASTFAYNDGVLGSFSRHATVQAGFFYNPTPYGGATMGVAPGVAHVDNFWADGFLTNLAGGSFPDKVVNLSVIYGDPAVNTTFDAAAARFNLVLVAAAGNGGQPSAPSSSFDAISVDTWPGVQAVGPAPDGTIKPDIAAPQTVTSRTTAIVSGAATLLVQAGTLGLAGAATQTKADAVDFRTIKALLLNSATPTPGMATTPSKPLDATVGAGVVDVMSAVANLAGGEVVPSGSFRVAAGASAWLSPATVTLSATGWDLASLTTPSGGASDAVALYPVTLAAGDRFVATLTWAADSFGGIDNLDLHLYDDATGALIASSVATRSSVERIALSVPASGTYDIAVRLRGDLQRQTDRYALAFAANLDHSALACLAAGTRVLTLRGEVPVETLRPGDLVPTADGRIETVRFVGRRRVPRELAAGEAAPVRIAAGTLGGGLPRRDLVVSPDHALLLADAEGVALVNAIRLCNGASIRRAHPAGVTYLHVALGRHAALLAEGVPVESYRDTGNRDAFDNAAEAPPDLPRAPFAPVLGAGPRLARLAARLRVGAIELDPPPLLAAGSRWLAPDRAGPGEARFTVPPADAVRLVCRPFRPDWFGAPDGRTLGLPLTGLCLDGEPLDLDALLSPYPAEGEGGARWRWTPETCLIPLPPAAKPRRLDVAWIPGWTRVWRRDGFSFGAADPT